ncbi:MAG: rod-binding protein [Aquificaceae bacterium]
MDIKGKILFSVPSLTQQEFLKRDKKELALEFEAIFLKEILKEAYKPLLKDKSFDTKIYYDMFLENIGKELAKGGGIGLASFILKSMQRWEGLKE